MGFERSKFVDTIDDILQEWIYEWGYFEPDHYPMKGNNFKKKCLNCWAAEEVVEEVKKYPREDPLNIINNLRDRADNFCCIAKTTEARDIFTTLYDVSTNALDFLLSFGTI